MESKYYYFRVNHQKESDILGHEKQKKQISLLIKTLKSWDKKHVNGDRLKHQYQY